ncbi:Ig-like domain-containing protein [bacterium]|nr:Ig-like domain-containing protein [bacterium]
MKRTIQTLAILIAITLAATWMVGCGGGEEIPAGTFSAVEPSSGSEFVANQTVKITFCVAVVAFMVDGVCATGFSKSCAFQGDLKRKTRTSTKWRKQDADATAGGPYPVAYTVKAADPDPPQIASSDPGDGDKDLDPEKLNEDGMEIKFNEAVKKATVLVTIEGEQLKWTSELSDDGMTAAVIMLKGGEVSYESEIVLVVTAEDLAGNKMDETEITFTTAAKEE